MGAALRGRIRDLLIRLLLWLLAEILEEFGQPSAEDDANADRRE